MKKKPVKRTETIEMKQENLREFYITPLYLKTMKQRSRYWTEEFIKKQLLYFKQSIPEYHEAHDILENELHVRRLNHLRTEARSRPLPELKKLLEQYRNEADYCELIQAEIEIRKGAKELKDLVKDRETKIKPLDF